VGIRELKQNPSQVVQWSKLGDEVVVTERGVPVAKLMPLQPSALAELMQSGEVVAPGRSLGQVLVGHQPQALIPGVSLDPKWLEDSRADKF
jgi:prevent-host-death family protein